MCKIVGFWHTSRKCASDPQRPLLEEDRKSVFGESGLHLRPTAKGAFIYSSGSALSSQIVEIFRRKLELGRKHIILQVIDRSRAGDWQHDR